MFSPRVLFKVQDTETQFGDIEEQHNDSLTTLIICLKYKCWQWCMWGGHVG